MCGISGIVGTDTADLERGRIVRRMSATLVHRGPDGEGFAEDDRCALGFRRLAIVDLEASSPPYASEDGSIWTVGIESPLESVRRVQHALPLTDAALATSGDYRNFIEREGMKYSHTIDPRTLKPIEHALASVSVIADTCMEADALATGLMVMGPETGYNYAEEHGIPVLMMIHAESGFDEKATSAWTERFGALR